MAHVEAAANHLKRAGSHVVKAVEALLDDSPEPYPARQKPKGEFKEWAKEGKTILKDLFGNK